MQRMKQLSRTAWTRRPNHGHVPFVSHQNNPPQDPIHPWIMPEKCWSRLHIDHAVNFMGHTWLVLVDAFSKYPIVYATSSTSSKATIQLLEEDFEHFGFPHTIVSDNATSFTSEEFQEWCSERGITHLYGAPYHPATNGAAERLVQSFKSSLRKSSLPPKSALQEFLMIYRRTPLPSGMSPSELLNGRQIEQRSIFWFHHIFIPPKACTVTTPINQKRSHLLQSQKNFMSTKLAGQFMCHIMVVRSTKLLDGSQR